MYNVAIVTVTVVYSIIIVEINYMIVPQRTGYISNQFRYVFFGQYVFRKEKFILGIMQFRNDISVFFWLGESRS